MKSWFPTAYVHLQRGQRGLRTSGRVPRTGCKPRGHTAHGHHRCPALYGPRVKPELLLADHREAHRRPLAEKGNLSSPRRRSWAAEVPLLTCQWPFPGVRGRGCCTQTPAGSISISQSLPKPEPQRTRHGSRKTLQEHSGAPTRPEVSGGQACSAPAVLCRRRWRAMLAGGQSRLHGLGPTAWPESRLQK